MDQKNILEINDLHIAFSGQEVVKGINLVLEKGQTLGVVGESGSGKSVSALSIMGLLSQTGKISGGNIQFQSEEQGHVKLDQLNSSNMRRLRGNEIAMIFQEPMTSLNPVFSCGNQVSEAIRLHKNVSGKEAKELTLELFRKVELPRVEQIYDSYPHQISGGQKQRVMIAMAISCEPSLLIADEPTTALDVTVQKRIIELLIQLQAETNMAMIFITHDLGVVGEIADQILVMYQGEKVEYGSTKEIFEAPKHPYTQGLLACRPQMEVKPKRLLTLDDYLKPEKEENSTETPIFSDDEIKERLTKLMEKPPILEVKNLKTWFTIKPTFFWQNNEYVKAVDGVDFQVFPGETLGLVGESGCGKSTLGRSVLRLIEPTEGEIIYQGKNIRQLSPTELRTIRKDLQIIFQDPYSSLNPRIPIGKAIMEPMKVHGIGSSDKERKQKTIDLLERVQLPSSYFNRYPHEFSGGQRQRICIARTLAVKPRFIICDESVSALDVSVQAQVLNLLKDLQEEFGLTYIFISHDLSVVKFMSDRIMVMRKGIIEEAGAAEDIYRSPKSDYTKSLIEAVPPGTLEAIKTSSENRKRLREEFLGQTNN